MINCIQVSRVGGDKKCIEVSSNAGTCPIITAFLSSVNNGLELPDILESQVNCTTIQYSIVNFHTNISYQVDIGLMGFNTYMGGGVFWYDPPRRDVPNEDLIFDIRGMLGSNTTDWVHNTPTKLPITPTPVFGTPSNPTPSANDTIAIPISNYVVGTSLYDQPIISPDTDGSYVVYSGGGEVTLVVDSSATVGTTYNISIRGFDDCSSESEIATIAITTGGQRYTYIQDIVDVECPPLCAEGYYFDCATESCVAYSGYTYEITSYIAHITKTWYGTTAWTTWVNTDIIWDYINPQAGEPRPVLALQDFNITKVSQVETEPNVKNVTTQNNIPLGYRQAVAGVGDVFLGTYSYEAYAEAILPDGWIMDMAWYYLDSFESYEKESTVTYSVNIYGVK